jgi:hypothetical protein
MSSNGDAFDAFLMIMLALWTLGKKTSEESAISSYYFKITYYEHDLCVILIHLDHLAKVLFVKFLHCKITLTSFPYNTLWKEVTIGRHLRNFALSP